jgi:HEAT repeat protein
MVKLLLLSLPLAFAQTPEPRVEKDVAKLAQTVEKGTPAERLQALRQLADLGPDAKAAVPALLKTLHDPDETLRRRAGLALVAVGPKDIALVEPLVKALRGDDEAVQTNIGAVLAGIGPIATSKLIALLKDNDVAARRGSAIALEAFGVDALPATKALVKALGDADAGVRLAVAKALVKIEPKEKAAYPVLAEGLLKADPRGRQQIMMVLTESGQQALAAPVFQKMLMSDNPSLRHDAALGLRKLGKDAVPVLLEGLKHSAVEVRRDAAAGLFDVVLLAKRERERIPDDKDATEAEAKLKAVLDALKKAQPELTKALSDPDIELRLAVAKTLYQATGELEQALTPMVAALADKDPKVRKIAVQALRGMPDKSERMEKVLLAAAKDEVIDVRLEALTVLWLNHGESEAAQNALVEALKDPTIGQNAYAMVNRLVGQGNDLTAVILPLVKHPDAGMRARGVALLHKPGPEDDAVRAALIGALKDKVAAVRLQAVRSLTGAKEFPEEIVPPLVGTLSDADHEVRKATATALRRFVDHAAIVLPALTLSLRDKDDFVRSAAADSLAYYKDHAGACVPGLVKALREEDDDYVKERMVRTLALFGSDAKEAAPVLLDLIRKDPSFNMALVALGRIGADAKDAAPVLVEVLRKDGGNKNVQDALAGIGADAAPPVLKLLQDPSTATRLGAVTVLGKIGPVTNAGEALEARLKDPDPSVRIGAALAHFQVTTLPKAALATLTDACKSGDRKLRLQALKNLKEMAGAAADAVPMLVTYLSDPDAMIRRQAEDTLQAVDAEALARAKAAM